MCVVVGDVLFRGRLIYFNEEGDNAHSFTNTHNHPHIHEIRQNQPTTSTIVHDLKGLPRAAPKKQRLWRIRRSGDQKARHFRLIVVIANTTNNIPWRRFCAAAWSSHVTRNALAVTQEILFRLENCVICVL